MKAHLIMNEIPTQPSINTFVVRIWYESSLDAPRWRGRVEHLQSGRHLAFIELERILAFIGSLIGVADEQSDARRKSAEEHHES